MIIPDTYRSISSVKDPSLFNNQRIFFRVDLNVPLSQGKIGNDYRLQEIVPTLDFLQHHKATIIIATHIGRPTGAEETLSTQHLIPWFTQHGYTVDFAATIDQAYTLSIHRQKQIIMLENLRFFPGERASDETFAKQLARLGDYYVTDAFATLHRDDTSIALLPYLFEPTHRYIGFLIEQELQRIHQVLNNPPHPFVLVIGGGKVTDKIPLMLHLLEQIDIILLCPAIVFTFLYALGLPTGASLVDDTATSLCLDLLDRARRNKIQILFPTDYYVAPHSFSGKMYQEPCAAQALQSYMVGITIGPDTMRRYSACLNTAHTIVLNGLMGDINRPETLIGNHAILKALAENSTAVRIVGGGDSIAAAELLGFQEKIGHLSTGGGSLLALLSGQPLLGLKPFILKNRAKA